MSTHPDRVAGAARQSTHFGRALLCGTALLSSLALAEPAWAQATASLTADQVTILQRLVVSATRTSKRLLDVPATVSVITSEDLEKHAVRDIQDLVRYEPGVSVDRQTSITNPWGQLNSFTIRGMGGNRVQMMVDGSRIQERITDGSRDFVDVFNMKAVEIVRGPNSVLTGADAMAGLVAFRTKDPSDLLEGEDKPWAVEIKTAFDSYDNSWRKQITAAYDFGDVQILGSFGNLTSTEPKMTKADPDGGIWGCTRPAYFRCDALFPADTTAYNGLVKLVWTPNADHEIKLTGEFFDRQTTIQQIYDSSAAASGIPTTTAYVSTAYPRTLDMERYRLAVEHKWQVGAPWLDNVEWRLSYSPQKRVTESTSYRTYSNRTARVYQLRDYGETFLEGDIQAQSSFDLGETHHTLTYGFDGDFTQTNYEGRNETWASNTGLTTIALNQGFSFPRTQTVRADLFLQDEIKLFDDRLTITPGLRLANYRIEPDGAYTSLPGYTPDAVSRSELIKKLSASYKLDDSYSVYAAYGEGFKMPNAQQLFQSSQGIGNTGFVDIVPNPNLQPESVQNFEVGVRGEFDRGWFSVSTFYSDYSNFIRSLQPYPGAPLDGNGDPTIYWSDNVESVKLWGIEVGGEFEVYDNLFASANVSWQRGIQRVSSGSAETAFDGAVPLTAVLGLRYQLPEQNLELELVSTLAAGVTERADPDAFKPGGYAVFDAFATWKPTEKVEVTFGVQNIFDTRYFPNTLSGYANTPASAAVANVNPLELQVAPGRTFKVGTTIKF